MRVSSPVTLAQRASVAAAVDHAERATGLRFAVHVGPLEEGRASAHRRHASLTDPARSVLLAVDPAARSIEIVTGEVAARSVSDRTCGLAALTMGSCFAAGDLVRGLCDGIRLIADHARTPEVKHLDTV